MKAEEFTRLQRHVHNIAISKIPINELDDFVSSAVSKIWSKKSQFQGKSNFSAWVRNIVRNEVAGFYRRKNLRVEPLSDTYDVADPSQLYPIEEVEMDIFLRQALPLREYQVFHLYWNGMTQREAAEHLGIALGTAKTRLRSSMKRLRRIYKSIRPGLQYST